MKVGTNPTKGFCNHFFLEGKIIIFLFHNIIGKCAPSVDCEACMSYKQKGIRCIMYNICVYVRVRVCIQVMYTFMDSMNVYMYHIKYNTIYVFVFLYINMCYVYTCPCTHVHVLLYIIFTYAHFNVTLFTYLQ